MNKLWLVQTVEYHLPIKRSKLWIHVSSWIDLKGIMLSKKKISKAYMLYNLYDMLKNSKMMKTETNHRLPGVMGEASV